MERLSSSLQSAKEDLAQVSDSLTALDDLTSIKKTLSELQCSFNRFIRNNTEACCPLGWDLYSRNCYYFSTNGMSWHRARDHCTSRGASLLVLQSADERRFVVSRTAPLFFWLGLSDERTGSWEWVDRTPYKIDRREWMPGQPDDWRLHGLEGGEDCAHFHSDGRYNDDHCSRHYRYICKAPVTANITP
ncbi:asialoglycoprotein receptor 1-like [Denticeps clupeoides]|uniref:asialoglycoprotein receptor 1-like n=1 Tax=Denticeps clupeoides TaxID=299321 RepID=UPI0010A3C74E|nr:asialoglycoprotein receptor 1-like [Denticeps clupeoides]XP_028822522.1 asialoglycoprotein receptor 1-like [Denticeps clupeoides]